jgi:hypothetical protein
MALTSLGEIISWGRAGLLFDRRDVESDQMTPLKPYMTMEDELRVASSINPAPVLVSLPHYAATNRAVNIFESHSSMVSFTAVEILFQDTISTDLIKKSKYVSNRKVDPWSRGVKSSVEDEFLRIKKSSMASWNESVKNSLATERLSNASASPDKTASNSHSPNRDSYLERRRREDEERRKAEGQLTEDGLLSIFSPLRSKRRVDVSSDADFREVSAWEQPAAQPPTGGGAKTRSSSMYSARPANLGGQQPGVLESFASRRREIPVSPMNAAQGKQARINQAHDDSQNAWLAESGDNNALSLSAVRNLAAMIQNIKKESIQQSKHQPR